MHEDHAVVLLPELFDALTALADDDSALGPVDDQAHFGLVFFEIWDHFAGVLGPLGGHFFHGGGGC